MPCRGFSGVRGLTALDRLGVGHGGDGDIWFHQARKYGFHLIEITASLNMVLGRIFLWKLLADSEWKSSARLRREVPITYWPNEISNVRSGEAKYT
jgi:hypothetical protein